MKEIWKKPWAEVVQCESEGIMSYNSPEDGDGNGNTDDILPDEWGNIW